METQQQADMQISFSDAEFATLGKLVTDATGIVMPPQKKAMMYRRLVRRLRTLNLDSFSAYIGMLQQQAARNDTAELMEVINAITTNVTRFFREEHHFDDMRQLLTNWGKTIPMVVWSSACSTGEEPWSAAMVAAEVIAKNPDFKIKIYASDIDQTAIATARKGVYRLKPDEVKNHTLMKKYLQPTGETMPDGTAMYEVDKSLRELVQFQGFNLIEDKWRMAPKAQVIFCRNVIIYFGKETKRQLFARYADVLPAGGTLYIGHSESMIGLSDDFNLEGRTIYRRKERS